MYVCVCLYMSVCLGVCMSTCMCMYKCVCVCVSMCVWLFVAAFRTRSCDPNSVTGGSDLCSLWTRHTDDLRTDPWDDSEICTDLCGEDQTAIWIQNRVISCECLLLYHFLIYRCQCYLYATCIISCDCRIYFISMITCIISCDVSRCLLYLYSWYEYLSVSFHV